MPVKNNPMIAFTEFVAPIIMSGLFGLLAGDLMLLFGATPEMAMAIAGVIGYLSVSAGQLFVRMWDAWIKRKGGEDGA